MGFGQNAEVTFVILLIFIKCDLLHKFILTQSWEPEPKLHSGCGQRLRLLLCNIVYFSYKRQCVRKTSFIHFPE